MNETDRSGVVRFDDAQAHIPGSSITMRTSARTLRCGVYSTARRVVKFLSSSGANPFFDGGLRSPAPVITTRWMRMGVTPSMDRHRMLTTPSGIRNDGPADDHMTIL
jgi:hypothetical protein